MLIGHERPNDAASDSVHPLDDTETCLHGALALVPGGTGFVIVHRGHERKLLAQRVSDVGACGRRRTHSRDESGYCGVSRALSAAKKGHPLAGIEWPSKSRRAGQAFRQGRSSQMEFIVRPVTAELWNSTICSVVMM